MMSGEPSANRATPSDEPRRPVAVRARLPLARPVVTYGLLGLIAAVFAAETFAGGSTNSRTLIFFGAQVNLLVAAGELWRLVAAMFLHIGLQHVAFNAWALFSLGRDVEAFYGSVWFTAIYLVAGLFGNVAFYILGGNGISAGASGAVFGLIGAELAYFLRNRALFGTFGRQRLGNLAVLIGINLLFGFTMPGINNIAHLGGLLSGFLLAWVLAPHYRPDWVSAGDTLVARLVDTRSNLIRVLGLAAAVAVLAAGIFLGGQRWAGAIQSLISDLSTGGLP